MSAPKLTPWFNSAVVPARKGVYQRKFFDGKTHYSRWDGLWWCLFASTPDAASIESRPSQYQHCQWRGLAEQPK